MHSPLPTIRTDHPCPSRFRILSLCRSRNLDTKNHENCPFKIWKGDLLYHCFTQPWL